MLWLCLYIYSLTKKRANVILPLTPPLTLVKGGIKYLDVFAMHLIPVKGEVKHLNNFDSSFDARQRRSKTPQFCIPLIMSKAFKDTTALHTFDLLCQRRSKTPRLCTTLILTLCHVKGEVKYGYIVRLLFKHPSYLCFRIFFCFDD